MHLTLFLTIIKPYFILRFYSVYAILVTMKNFTFLESIKRKTKEANQKASFSGKRSFKTNEPFCNSLIIKNRFSPFKGKEAM